MSDPRDLTTRADAARPGAVERHEPPTDCPYCGSRLNPLFYFCAACGTPYKQLERVLPPHRPRRLTEGELVALKTPQVAPLFWTYLAVIVGSWIAIVSLFPDDEAAALALQDTVIIVTTAVLAAIYWRSLRSQIGRLGLHRPAAWLAIGLLPVVLAIGRAWIGLAESLVGDEAGRWFDALRDAGMTEAALIFSIAVVPAVTEEIAFRGLVQHWLHTALLPWKAIVFASFLFTALHFSIYSFPYIFLVGCLLGWAKWKTGSLYPSMLIHFLHNLVVIELFYPPG